MEEILLILLGSGHPQSRREIACYSCSNRIAEEQCQSTLVWIHM